VEDYLDSRLSSLSFNHKEAYLGSQHNKARLDSANNLLTVAAASSQVRIKHQEVFLEGLKVRHPKIKASEIFPNHNNPSDLINPLEDNLNNRACSASHNSNRTNLLGNLLWE